MSIPIKDANDQTRNVATDLVSGDEHQISKVAYGASGSATQVSSSNPLPVAQTGALPAGSNVIGGVTAADGALSTVGTTTDSDTANTVIGRLKKIVALLGGGLPAALSGSGNLKVVISEAGTATPVTGSGTFNVNPTGETAGVGVGAAADAEASGNGSAIAILKRLRTLLAGGLPSALSAGGNLKVVISESGTATPVTGSGTFNVNPTGETAGVGVGAAADAEASGNGSVIAILKRLRTLLAGGLPSALTAGGGVKVGLVDALPAGGNNIGDVDVVTQPARSRTTDSISAALQSDAVMVGLTALTPKFALVNATASGDTTVVAAVSGKKLRVLSYVIVAGAAVTVKWRSGTSDISGPLPLAQYGGVSAGFAPTGHFETAASAALVINLSAATTVGGHVTYVEV